MKTFHEPTFEELGLASHFAEQYYSISGRGVLRGLHFQTPPYDHDKLITCLGGEILDVALDLRKDSPTYGRHVMVTLSAATSSQIYIPRGFAHGFYVLSDEAVVLYDVTSAYAPDNDKGVLWSSAGIPWPDDSPVLSERDMTFPAFQEFDTPF